jgi:ABC-type multidrug transport system ATPase subunit
MAVKDGLLVCPGCWKSNSADAGQCSDVDCRLDLRWVHSTIEFHRALSKRMEPVGDQARPVLDLNDRLPDLDPQVLSDYLETRIGCTVDNERQIFETGIEPLHCVIARRVLDDDVSPEYWIASCSVDATIWVNGKRVISTRLTAGDLVSIGPIAFIFNQQDQLLVPVLPIKPVAVKAEGLKVFHRRSPKSTGLPHDPEAMSNLRLSIDKLNIGHREFVGIIGGSGSGKSTLLKAIGGLQGCRHTGTISIDSRNIDREGDVLKEVIGYVPQEETVHQELTALEAMQYSAQLRGRNKENIKHQAERHLQKLQLPADRWDAPIRELSGGERKRVCTAVELLSEPRLLLLDEPGSGLDTEREQVLMKSLRSLSQLGCTVIVVAHNVELVRKYCNRLLVIKQGEIGFDGLPRDFQYYDTLSDFPTETPVIDQTDDGEQGGSEPAGSTSTSHQMACTFRFHHYRTLVQRECAIINSSFKSRFIFPTIILPLIFALTLGIAVNHDSRGLLWFFSVLATIWMGASLALMSIVGEREIFEHEKHLYLRIPEYVFSKVTVFAVIGALQVLLFCCLVALTRYLGGADYLRTDTETELLVSDLGWIIFVLSVVSVGASSAGLLISAIVKRDRSLANLILPLFMIAQIVFSVPICMKKSDATLKSTYMLFHSESCKNYKDCGGRAVTWDKPYNLWFCGLCDSNFEHAKEELAKNEVQITKSKLIAQTKQALQALLLDKKEWEKTSEDIVRQNARLPNRLAAISSYFMLSRYGDLSIRSFNGSLFSDKNKDLNDSWFWESIRILCGISSLQILAICIVLWYQTRKRPLLRGF